MCVDFPVHTLALTCDLWREGWVLEWMVKPSSIDVTTSWGSNFMLFQVDICSICTKRIEVQCLTVISTEGLHPVKRMYMLHTY